MGLSKVLKFVVRFRSVRVMSRLLCLCSGYENLYSIVMSELRRRDIFRKHQQPVSADAGDGNKENSTRGRSAARPGGASRLLALKADKSSSKQQQHSTNAKRAQSGKLIAPLPLTEKEAGVYARVRAHIWLIWGLRYALS